MVKISKVGAGSAPPDVSKAVDALNNSIYVIHYLDEELAATKAKLIAATAILEDAKLLASRRWPFPVRRMLRKLLEGHHG